jgi:anti-sigma-K factor RskA
MTYTDHSRYDDDEMLEVIGRSLPRVTPPADMFDRILAEVAPEATVVPMQPRSRRRRLLPVAGALAAAAAIVLAVVAIGRDTAPTPDARAAISGKSDRAVTGQATLYGSNAAGGTVRISLRDVPPAPSGHHYEVWVLRSNGDGVMEAVGSFSPSTSDVRLDLPLPGPGDYAAVDISVEEDGGSPAHSDTSLAGGTFT